MDQDVAAYMRYYNLERLHTVNGDVSPVEYEICKNKVSFLVNQNNISSYSINE